MPYDYNQLQIFALFFTAPYIKQCHRNDPKLVDCFIGAIEHLKPYLANGIPDIQVSDFSPMSARGDFFENLFWVA